MKILHVIPAYEPAWAFGGTVTATSNLCRALARHGVDITVYTTDADGKGGHLNVQLNELVDLGGVKVWYFHCNFGVKRAFYSKGLARKLKETVKDFDLVHVSAIWQWIGFDVYRKCVNKNIPYILTPHSSLMKFAFYSVGSQLKKKLYWKFVGQKTIKKADAIQFLCEGEREESREFFGTTQNFIVPNGIAIEKFKSNPDERLILRKRFNIPEKALVLLFLGRIHPKKQIELIIRSLPSVFECRREVFFIIAGPVENEDYFESLKKLSQKVRVDANLVWNGPVVNQKVLNFYSASDMMVLPSIVEGISMAITEAMAASLPILISNRVANYIEVEKDNSGIVVEPAYESVKNALINISTTPNLLKELSKNARKSAENRYDIDKVVSLMIKAYEDVLSGKRSPELQWK